jgi:glycosyltransferase involved in cell wall biosynthesis
LRKGFIKKQLALWTYENVHLRLANALIACSRAEAVSLQRRFPAKEIAVIPNGVSDDFFATIPERSTKSEKKKLLFFSQLIPVKGIERLLEAVAAVGPDFTQHWNLELAGYGEKKYLTKLRTLVNKLDLELIVTFTGPAYGAERIKLIDSCDAFILPTYNENFGIVVAEAMARGKLVITTKGAPWSDITDFDTGFWVDNTVEGLKSSLIALSSLTLDELTQKGVNGRRVCEQKYRWDAIRKSYNDLYQYVLGEAGRPHFLHS